MRRILLFTTIGLVLFTGTANAQFEIGGSYEFRNEDPQHGFGLQMQLGLLEPMPMINFGLRAHASIFNETNNVDEDNVTFSLDLSNYDVGGGVWASVTLGIVEPYGGIGLGTEKFKTVSDNYDGPNDLNPNSEESNVYWNLHVGTKFVVMPLFKPFIEYRYATNELSNPSFSDIENRRMVFGVLLSF